MLGYVVPPITQRKLEEFSKSVATAFCPKELIDILLPEDVAYYIFVNRTLQSLGKSAAASSTIYNKVLHSMISPVEIESYFYTECYGDDHYMEKLQRIIALVPNIQFILGIDPSEHISSDVLTVEQLPKWFKEQLVETTVGTTDNMQCTDATQYNLFVLRPVDERFTNIVLIDADKSKTDHGEVILNAVDKSIEASLRFVSFADLAKTRLFSLFAKLSATYRLI